MRATLLTKRNREAAKAAARLAAAAPELLEEVELALFVAEQNNWSATVARLTNLIARIRGESV